MSRALLLLLLLAPSSALAQTLDLAQLLPHGAGSASGKMVQVLAALTVLSIAPGLLIMVTSFTRFAIALSFLRAGLGLQSTPANLVLISLALFMTFFVMTPTFNQAWETGLRPLMENKISEAEAFDKISKPFRQFMAQNVRDKDLRLFEDMTRQNALSVEPQAGARPPIKLELKPDPKSGMNPEPVEPSLQVLAPAFMISELRRGFEIGFLIVVPFLVIDMIVAVITMAMGMMMLPPTTISLPVKILFFVLIDGWNLLVGHLVRSFG